MKTKQLLLSVGITAHNEAANIRVLIAGILSQRQNGFRLREVIIISDGSTDRTVAEIKKIKSKKIRLFIESKRRGQVIRQNELLRYRNKRTQCFLLVEADVMPYKNTFIASLVEAIPTDGIYSMIVGNAVPVKAQTFFEQVMNFGFNLRKEIYENATKNINVYLCGGHSGRLFSRTFLKKFKWQNGYHEDIYSFRQAINSKMPIIRTKKAILNFRSVNNFHEYLMQSGKFQKARSKETKKTAIFKVRLNYFFVLIILVANIFRTPLQFGAYFLVLFISRMSSIFLPRYHRFWSSYGSTKQVGVKYKLSRVRI